MSTLVEGAPVIVLRQSPEWDKLDYSYLSTLGQFEKMARLPDGFVSEMIVQWDKLFKNNYFDTRQKLKSLTLTNLNSVMGCRLTSLSSCYQELPKSKLYLFIDDDDFYSPSFVSDFKRYCSNDEEFRGVVWDHAAIIDGHIQVRRKLSKKKCFTNNYAVTDKFFTKNTKLNRLSDVDQHLYANRTFFLLDDGFECQYIPKVLSFANKHPCSPSLYFHEFGTDFSKKNMSKYIESYVSNLSSCEVGEDYLWMSPYVKKIEAIFSEVLRTAKK